MQNRTVKLLFVLLVAAVFVSGQQDRGTITGTVTDASGSVAPNVKVTVRQVDTGTVYNSVSNAAGQYRVPNLPIGAYRVTFESQGFKSVNREGIQLSVAQVVAVDAQLQVGNVAETIEVTAQTSLLNTETPEVGTVLESRTVIDMPLGFSGGRYAENFAYKLTPGVGGNNWESHINGAPSFSKEIVLDGASATIYISGHMGESSPSMEALEEFKVQTSGMSAEYTRTAGGVFNFVMKSGANKHHGSGLYQWHNESFDANTFANNAFGRPRRRDRRDNWALSLGGPVGIPKLKTFKDRWFWYSAYEKYNETFAGGGNPSVTMPQTDWYTGNLSSYLTNQVIGQDAIGRDILRGQIFDPSTTRTVDGKVVRDPFPGNIIPQSRISAVSQNVTKILGQYYKPQLGTLLNNSFFPVSNQAGFNQTQFSTKSDFNITTNQRLSGSFVFVDRPRTLLDQGGAWNFDDPNGGPFSRARLQWVSSHYVRLAHDYTLSPTMMNHVMVAYNRQINPSTSKHVGENGAAALGLKGIAGFNYPQIGGLSGDRVSFPMLGYNANDIGAATAYQLVDTFSWIRGKHSFKFGFDYRWNGLNWRVGSGPAQFNFGADVTGLPGFNQTGHGFASMLLGQVTSASVPTDNPVGSQFPMYSGFVQDDWKVSRSLTVNLGLRYDFQPQGTEKYDRLHNFNPSIIDPKYGIPGAIEFAGNGQGRNGKSTFYDNCINCGWAPRIGFAWQLPQTGLLRNMTARGGYGVFYGGRIPNGWSGVPWGNKLGFTMVNQVNQPSPNSAAFNWDNGYSGVSQTAKLDPSAARNIWGPVSWDPGGGRVGYTQQWNFNIQKELPGNMVLDLGYIGTKSTGLQANELRKMNQLPTKALALGDLLGNWVGSDGEIPAAAKAMGARYPYGNEGEYIPLWQTLTPYPTVIYWSDLYSWNSPLGFSNYHALQVQLNKRLSRGLQFLSNYSFSKNIGNISSAFGDTWGMNYSRPMDYNNLSLEKSVMEFDQTHVLKIGASYDTPFGRGRSFGGDMPRVANFAFGGWTLQYIGNYASGTPVGFGATGTPNSNFATNRPFINNPNGGSLLNPNYNASTFDMTDLSNSRPDKKYLNTSKIIDPVTVNRYARGNAPRLVSQLRNFATYSEDVSLQKNFVPREGMRIQFRAEGLNVFNRHRFTGFNTTPSSPLFGQISGVSDDRRQLQFGIRADF
ncbi:MAG: carboxypeptidase-like regulatory domain-containing protein [Bryobacteraceae bacterium]|nr:carboxypeptidase-like regulatory domain-containing protein [Bryobacteraceae bacterium]